MRRSSEAVSVRRTLSAALLSPWGWLAAWAAAAAVTAIVYLAPQTAPPGDYHADKIVHLLVFFMLGVPLRHAGLRPVGVAILVVVNVSLAVGLELAQSFVPGRQFGMLDIAANLMGLGLGVMTGMWLEASLAPSRRPRGAAFGVASPVRATRAK
jgi:VanZ family protein